MVTNDEIKKARSGIEHVRWRDNYWRVSRKTQDTLLDYAIAILTKLEGEGNAEF